MATYFSPADGNFRYEGSHVTAASMTQGTVVKLLNNGKVDVCTTASGDIPYGVALLNNYGQYKPLSKDIPADTYVTVLQGSGLCYVSSDGIDGSPAPGAVLFVQSGGKFGTTNAGNQVPVGVYRGQQTIAYGAADVTTPVHAIELTLPGFTR